MTPMHLLQILEAERASTLSLAAQMPETMHLRIIRAKDQKKRNKAVLANTKNLNHSRSFCLHQKRYAETNDVAVSMIAKSKTKTIPIHFHMIFPHPF